MPDAQSRSPDLTGKELQIKTLRGSDSIEIVLSGELDSASTEQLDTLIREAEETDIERIVVNLADVDFVDSTGLSVILHAKKRCNGRLSFIPSKQRAVTRLLELTGTVGILDSGPPDGDPRAES